MKTISDSHAFPPDLIADGSIERIPSVVKAGLVTAMTYLPTLRTQRAAAALVRRAWPGFRSA